MRIAPQHLHGLVTGDCRDLCTVSIPVICQRFLPMFAAAIA